MPCFMCQNIDTTVVAIEENKARVTRIKNKKCLKVICAMLQEQMLTDLTQENKLCQIQRSLFLSRKPRQCFVVWKELDHFLLQCSIRPICERRGRGACISIKSIILPFNPLQADENIDTGLPLKNRMWNVASDTDTTVLLSEMEGLNYDPRIISAVLIIEQPQLIPIMETWLQSISVLLKTQTKPKSKIEWGIKYITTSDGQNDALPYLSSIIQISFDKLASIGAEEEEVIKNLSILLCDRLEVLQHTFTTGYIVINKTIEEGLLGAQLSDIEKTQCLSTMSEACIKQILGHNSVFTLLSISNPAMRIYQIQSIIHEQPVALLLHVNPNMFYIKMIWQFNSKQIIFNDIPFIMYMRDIIRKIMDREGVTQECTAEPIDSNNPHRLILYIALEQRLCQKATYIKTMHSMLKDISALRDIVGLVYIGLSQAERHNYDILTLAIAQPNSCSQEQRKMFLHEMTDNLAISESSSDSD